ncbi:MAG TPA: glutathione S-transferase family protein, partial [Henriciella marina]|nr:glutathione S-transferase family protein [Henriciella marina]
SVLPPLEPCLTATCKEYLGRMKERPAFKRAQERQKQALVVEVSDSNPI